MVYHREKKKNIGRFGNNSQGDVIYFEQMSNGRLGEREIQK